MGNIFPWEYNYVLAKTSSRNVSPLARSVEASSSSEWSGLRIAHYSLPRSSRSVADLSIRCMSRDRGERLCWQGPWWPWFVLQNDAEAREPRGGAAAELPGACLQRGGAAAEAQPAAPPWWVLHRGPPAINFSDVLTVVYEWYWLFLLAIVAIFAYKYICKREQRFWFYIYIDLHGQAFYFARIWEKILQ